MQGIISAAGLLQLSTLGLRDCFDAVYGASAGAINATYFLSGQDRGIDVYTDHLCCGKFLDLTTLLPPALRAWNLYLSGGGSSSGGTNGTAGGVDSSFDHGNNSKSDGLVDAGSASSLETSYADGIEDRRLRAGAEVVAEAHSGSGAASSSPSPVPSRQDRPAMDLDYLFDQVLTHKIPLNWQAVIDSPLPLKVRNVPWSWCRMYQVFAFIGYCHRESLSQHFSPSAHCHIDHALLPSFLLGDCLIPRPAESCHP